MTYLVNIRRSTICYPILMPILMSMAIHNIITITSAISQQMLLIRLFVFCVDSCRNTSLITSTQSSQFDVETTILQLYFISLFQYHLISLSTLISLLVSIKRQKVRKSSPYTSLPTLHHKSTIIFFSFRKWLGN